MLDQAGMIWESGVSDVAAAPVLMSVESRGTSMKSSGGGGEVHVGLAGSGCGDMQDVPWVAVTNTQIYSDCDQRLHQQSGMLKFIMDFTLIYIFRTVVSARNWRSRTETHTLQLHTQTHFTFECSLGACVFWIRSSGRMHKPWGNVLCNHLKIISLSLCLSLSVSLSKHTLSHTHSLILSLCLRSEWGWEMTGAWQLRVEQSPVTRVERISWLSNNFCYPATWPRLGEQTAN